MDARWWVMSDDEVLLFFCSLKKKSVFGFHKQEIIATVFHNLIVLLLIKLLHLLITKQMANTTIVESEKPFEVLCEALKASVLNNKFGVLHFYDMKETMAKKGVEFDRNVRIFEVCNPHKAKQVLETNIALNMGLPCRVSVWEEDGRCKVGMINPGAILGMMTNGEEPTELAEVAVEVQGTLERIISEAV